jgi:maltose alpha-D-glucosyltransferase / alpha-amylase
VLLAEANQWPEDVRPYFGDGDEFHMAFHFPLMPRMFMALRREDRKPMVEILERTPPIPGVVPVGHLPAQPRRADARDGHRRRARLHVRRVRRIRMRASTSASAAGWRRCSRATAAASS